MNRNAPPNPYAGSFTRSSASSRPAPRPAPAQPQPQWPQPQWNPPQWNPPQWNPPHWQPPQWQQPQGPQPQWQQYGTPGVYPAPRYHADPAGLGMPAPGAPFYPQPTIYTSPQYVINVYGGSQANVIAHQHNQHYRDHGAHASTLGAPVDFTPTPGSTGCGMPAAGTPASRGGAAAAPGSAPTMTSDLPPAVSSTTSVASEPNVEVHPPQEDAPASPGYEKLDQLFVTYGVTPGQFFGAIKEAQKDVDKLLCSTEETERFEKLRNLTETHLELALQNFIRHAKIQQPGRRDLADVVYGLGALFGDTRSALPEDRKEFSSLYGKIQKACEICASNVDLKSSSLGFLAGAFNTLRRADKFIASTEAIRKFREEANILLDSEAALERLPREANPIRTLGKLFLDFSKECGNRKKGEALSNDEQRDLAQRWSKRFKAFDSVWEDSDERIFLLDASLQAAQNLLELGVALPGEDIVKLIVLLSHYTPDERHQGSKPKGDKPVQEGRPYLTALRLLQRLLRQLPFALIEQSRAAFGRIDLTVATHPGSFEQSKLQGCRRLLKSLRLKLG